MPIAKPEKVDIFMRKLITEILEDIRNMGDEKAIKELTSLHKKYPHHSIFLMFKYFCDKTVEFNLLPPEQVRYRPAKYAANKSPFDLYHAIQNMWVFLKPNSELKYHPTYSLDHLEEGISEAEKGRRYRVKLKRDIHYQKLLETLGHDDAEFLECVLRKHRLSEYVSNEILKFITSTTVNPENLITTSEYAHLYDGEKTLDDVNTIVKSEIYSTEVKTEDHDIKLPEKPKKKRGRKPKIDKSLEKQTETLKKSHDISEDIFDFSDNVVDEKHWASEKEKEDYKKHIKSL